VKRLRVNLQNVADLLYGLLYSFFSLSRESPYNLINNNGLVVGGQRFERWTFRV